ncbi:hypothetical protein [Paenibacillus dakarensis]|uniref:hypothetical protein n=1 Tax=Paenibacillus dakarensis TaxID=1527293 RepID=UPI0006D58B3E|nr:hypothetical protein [Paenibacillus dakarensis]
MNWGVIQEIALDEAKQRVFSRLDDLIDRDIDVLSIRKELPSKEYDCIRKQAVRAFGSYNQALIEYGLYDSSGTPPDIEVARCFRLEGDYVVSQCVEESERLMDLYSIDELTFRRVSKEVIYSLEIDALDEFYRDCFPFEGYPTRRLREELPELYGYMRKHFGTFKRFLRAYKVPYKYIDRDYGGREAIKYGHEFERKLGVILGELYPNVEAHVKIGSCIPDFIVGSSTWVDAKLSAGTIRDPRSRTLEKYSIETDQLTVYYARDREPPFRLGFAEIKHISTLYPPLHEIGRADLVHDMNAFITSISFRGEDAA